MLELGAVPAQVEIAPERPPPARGWGLLQRAGPQEVALRLRPGERRWGQLEWARSTGSRTTATSRASGGIEAIRTCAAGSRRESVVDSPFIAPAGAGSKSAS